MLKCHSRIRIQVGQNLGLLLPRHLLSNSQFHAETAMPEEILGDTGEEVGRVLETRLGSTSDEPHRMIARLAKRKEWVIPDRIFNSGPEVLAAIAEDETADPRERNQCLRTLVMMVNANTGQASVDVRINQQVAIEVAPVAPENVNVDVQPAWAEDVNTDQMDATVAVMEQNGLLGRYVDQVKTSAPQLPSNGNGHSH